jgi:integrase
MPRTHTEIFPFSAESISAAFTRACQLLGIENLHFHDLRHEGISLLFEMGKTIPQAAAVSGHRSWTSLQRYSHIRQMGDKFAGWKWLEILTQMDAQNIGAKASAPAHTMPLRRMPVMAPSTAVPVVN